MTQTLPSTAATAPSPKYVAYYRVSTKAQGDSGLGLLAQRSAVAGYVKGEIIGEYTEVESGKKNERGQLAMAIQRAKQEGALLVIAKLDRLSRNASFIFTLRDSGVRFECVDMPDANTLTIGILATLAQHERELISSRTRAALAVKKSQGALLGTPKNLTEAAKRQGTEATRRNAQTHPANRRALSVALLLKQVGKNYTQIAQHLNQTGFQTARGCAFQATQVRRLFQRQVLLDPGQSA